MWTSGFMKKNGKTYSYEMKIFKESSAFGIDYGKISKLSIICEGKEVINYDRGWDIMPGSDDVNAVLEELLSRYN